MAEPVGSLPGRRPAVQRPRSGAEERGLGSFIRARSGLKGVNWTLPYIGLLGYTLAIITYALPIGEASMIAALVGVVLMGRGIRLPAFLLLFGALILWSILGSFSSAYPEVVYDSLDTAVRIWLVAFVAVNAIRTPAQLRFYLMFFLACFAMYPARGAIFNYIGGYTVWGRTIWNYIYENPNDFAALTFLPLSIAVALFMTESNRLFKWGAAASLVVLPILILMTQSRGALLALVAVGLLALLWQRRRGRVLAGLAVLAVVAALVVPNSAWERFSGLSSLTSTETIAEADPEGSAEARWRIWRTAFLVIRDHPFSGVGLGAYEFAHARYAPMVEGAPQGLKDAHSTYLSMLATTGVPGLLLFMWMVAAGVSRGERVRRRLKAEAPEFASMILYVELGLAAYLLAAIFGSYELLSFPLIQLALIWTAADIADRERRRLNSRHAAASGRRTPVVV